MKLLIAYDGSPSAKNAIHDLRHAGLPEIGVQATVLSVGEVRTPTEPAFNLEPTLPLVSYAIENTQDILAYAREAAEKDAEDGTKMVRELFPQWEIAPCARLNSPAATILDIAASWKPDLIVMGSHGRSALKRLFLGSVSLRVLSETRASVRIVKQRANDKSRQGPHVVLLAFDGSEGSRKTVHQLMHRTWAPDTRLHIVTVIDVGVLSSLDYIWLVGKDLAMYQNDKETHLERVLHSLEHEMRKHFELVTTAAPVGVPIHEILEEAKRVHADCIFIGSRGLSRLERLLIGSVARGIAAHSEATVEIVR